jgi:hypothetical protein
MSVSPEREHSRPAAVRRIYVASSWRNPHQPLVVASLRDAGHEVYDFRNPAPGNNGFAWGDMDRRWQEWEPKEYRDALAHPVAQKGFGLDYGAMEWADTGVLVLPSGRSAHIEAGYFNGIGKYLYILLLEPQEPELMYLMADRICLSVPELLAELSGETGGAL